MKNDQKKMQDALIQMLEQQLPTYQHSFIKSSIDTELKPDVRNIDKELFKEIIELCESKNEEIYSYNILVDTLKATAIFLTIRMRQTEGELPPEEEL